MIGTALPDGAPLAVAAARAGDRRPLRVADARVLRLVHGRARCCRPSIGGDAVRIFETSRRHPGRTGDITAIVLLERGLGGAGDGAPRRDRLRARARALRRRRVPLARGRVRARHAPADLPLLRPLRAAAARAGCGRSSRRLRVERPLRAFYDGVHHFRGHPRLLLGVFVFTTAIQAVRILSIWAAGKAVGIELGPRIYYVMGPLFFLVLLVPFTLNGFAVREAFFVSFLGSVGVPADAGVRRRLPLLPRDRRARAARAALILLWEGVARRRAGPAARAWLTRAPRVRRRHLRRAAVDRAVPRERRGRRHGRRRQRLDATGRSRSSASGSPPCSVVEQENRGLAAGWNRGIAETAGDARADPQRRRLARRRRARAARRPRPTGIRAPRVVGPRLLNPDGSLQRSVRGFPTALAARDRVPLPAQARAAVAAR